MKKDWNIVIVGVGGQGTLRASQVLGQLALYEGLEVKVSEVHGMSQRGGSVITYVRIGRELHSPIVAAGEADVVLGFELLEAARAKGYLRPDGTVIVNAQRILPMPVITGSMSYPEDPLSYLKEYRVMAADAQKVAMECGNSRTMNTVLMGMLSALMPFDEASWKRAIGSCVPRKTLPANIAAFERGQSIGQSETI